MALTENLIILHLLEAVHAANTPIAADRIQGALAYVRLESLLPATRHESVMHYGSAGSARA